MDFNKETQEVINKIVAEKLPAMIEKQAEKMIQDIVGDLFSYGSDARKQIKTKIEKSLDVNLQEFDLIDYNSIIAKTINENLIQEINLQPILAMTKNIIGFVNEKTINLQDIAGIFIDASRDSNDSDGEGEITFFVKENREYNWIEIRADVEPDKDENECAIRFIFPTKGSREGMIFSFKIKDDYYDRTHKEITPAKLTTLRGIEAKIFRLYSAQVQIVNYDQNINTYWDRY